MNKRLPLLVTMCFALGLVAMARLDLVSAKEYILTGAKPNQIVLIDPEARSVERVYEIPDDPGPSPLTIVPSPDGETAYVICNRWESVAGIDLDTGEQVFRADLSSPTVRVKAALAMEISPDGKELYVFHSPVKLESDHYEIQDTYVAVYNVSDGIGAKPVRTFPAPRRTGLLVSSPDGSKLYAVGWDITAFDPKTGKVLGTHKVLNWDRPNYTPPDLFAVWPLFEVVDVFSGIYYTAVQTDESQDPVYKTGVATLDLKTDEFVMKDFEDTSIIIFSSVVNPVRKNEAYAVYTQLTKLDLDQAAVVGRVDLDHTYYVINVSGDGKRIYVGGTMNDISAYSTDTLEKLGAIDIPGGNDIVLASLRVIQREGLPPSDESPGNAD